MYLSITHLPIKLSSRKRQEEKRGGTSKNAENKGGAWRGVLVVQREWEKGYHGGGEGEAMKEDGEGREEKEAA